MTKKVLKVWQRFSFWNKIRLFLGFFALGGEGALFYLEANEQYKVIGLWLACVAFALTVFIEDKDGDNKVDPL